MTESKCSEFELSIVVNSKKFNKNVLKNFECKYEKGNLIKFLKVFFNKIFFTFVFNYIKKQ